MKPRSLVAVFMFVNACRPSEAPTTMQQDTSMMGSMQMDGMAMQADAPIRITPRQVSIAGATFAIAREGPVVRTVRAFGLAVPNERGIGVVNARVNGWIEKLLVNETGVFVDVGTPLFELYSPELVAAQGELLLAATLSGTAGGEGLISGARQRLKQWNVDDRTIATIEETGQIQRRLTIYSPYRGFVLEKSVVEGQMVRSGTDLFRITDLSVLWVEPSIFEEDIAYVAVGQRAEVTFDVFAGETFDGQVTFISPTLDVETRSLRVRIEIPNHDGRIRPMMFGAVNIASRRGHGVIVPLTSVLPTGARNLVFVLRGGLVTPTEVTVGSRGDSTVVITQGVSVGDTVVSSATFLFDSEANLGAAMAGIMLDMGMGMDMAGMDMSAMTSGDETSMPMKMAGDSMMMPSPGDSGRGR